MTCQTKKFDTSNLSVKTRCGGKTEVTSAPCTFTMRFPLLLTVLQAKPSLAILWTKLLESQGLSEHLLHLAEDFITPRGAGVSEVCRSGGEVYLQQLQQVGGRS